MTNKNRRTKSDERTKKRVIFNNILAKGISTTKADILGDDPLEDKVYTKRIKIEKPYKGGVEIMSVAITSDSSTFGDASVSKVRINTKNVFGQWVNIFLHEAPSDMIETIYTSIK